MLYQLRFVGRDFLQNGRMRFVNRVVQRVLLPGVVDTHCGFKAFTAAAAAPTFAACTLDGWSFDLEVLARARAHGFRIQEVPVRWENDERSKAHLRQLPQEVRHLYRFRQQLRQVEKKQETVRGTWYRR